MEMIHFVTAAPGKKSKKGLFGGWGFGSSKIDMPVGQGFEEFKRMPVPESGLARAEWFEANRWRAPSGPSKAKKMSIHGGSDKPSIGSYERMVMGAERDDMLGAVVLRNHNWTNFNDPATEQSDDAARIWRAQTSASDGLWDGNNEVYVSQDAQTIWD